jgi:hypothetical protein
VTRRISEATSNSERHVVGGGWFIWKCTGGELNICNHEKIENVVTVHKHDLTAFGCIRFTPKPVTRRLYDFAAGDDECMIDECALAGFGIENHLQVDDNAAPDCCAAAMVTGTC